MRPHAPLLSVHISDFIKPHEDPIKSHTPLTQNASSAVLYNITTTAEDHGESYVVQRRFQAFYTFRKTLLQESQRCSSCLDFSTKLNAIPFPIRNVLHCAFPPHTKALKHRSVALTYFLRELVEITSTVGRKCAMNGTYLCNAVGMFLGVKSLMRFTLSKTDCAALQATRDKILFVRKNSSFNIANAFTPSMDPENVKESRGFRKRSTSTPMPHSPFEWNSDIPDAAQLPMAS